MRLWLFSLALCLSALQAADIPTPPALIPATKQAITITPHTLHAGRETISYQAHTGYLPLIEDGKETAKIFFTAYFADKTPPKGSTRPITFCFNGGPGASSIWLHMGAFGPERVAITDLEMNPSPAGYEPNPHTLLPVSDLVFVDPISTGFSTTLEGVDSKQYHGFSEDINSMTEFVRSFINHYQRWESPKYLLGESYGTVRIVGLADALSEQHHLQVNGLILISSCLDFQTTDFNATDTSAILSLPSFAAAAWYHKKLAPEELQKPLKQFLQEVEAFTLSKYSEALLKGDSITQEEKNILAEQLSKYTSIPKEFFITTSLRISSSVFRNMLLEHDEKDIGRFDSRYSGFQLDPESATALYDPSFDAITGAFVSSYQSYLQRALHFNETAPYFALNRDVHPWNFGRKELPAGLGYLSVTGQLRNNMIQNPNLRVYVASGYYDLATPYFAAIYNLNHLFLPTPIKKQIQCSFFEAGHLMFLHPPSLERLSTEIKEFIK